ncbi:MAG: Ig-like domain-containing protein [Oscillospiraceae bacterium]|nr:Ig-like domain-containing protein [Oscillospiraceae bacterium]
MKKVLSIILALALIISLVPSVFADGTEGETAQEYSGITVKYDFTKFEGAAVDVNTKTVTNYNTSYGFWKFRAAGNSRVAEILSFEETEQTVNYVKYSTNNTVDNETPGDNNKNLKDFYIAYEINVPKSGKYELELKFVKSGTYGASTQVYIFPASMSDNVFYDTMVNEQENLEKTYRQGEIFSFCDKAIAKNKYASATVELGEKYFDKGNYIIAFAAVDKGQANGTYPNCWMGFKNIVLDGDGSNAENTVPMSIATEISKTELDLDTDDITAQMTSKVYMSNLDEVTDIITYESNDTKVASVDETGKVTALSYGVKPVTITAKAEANGVSVESSKEISVKKTGISIAYNVGTDALAKKSDGYLTALTKDNANNFYRYYGMGTTSATNPSQTDGHLRDRSDAVIGMRGESTLAFEAYVPESGFYTMEMKHLCTAAGKMAAVYIGKDGKVSLVYNKRDDLGNKAGSYACYASSNTTATSYITGIKIDEPGWYVISFTMDEGATAPDGVTWGNDIYIGDFTLISGEGGEPAPMPAMIKLGADKLEVGGTTTAEAIKYLSDGNPAGEAATISAVTSSNEGVVKLEGNTATAVGAGKATLSATVTYGGETENITREVTVIDKPAGQTVSFAADGVSSVYVNNEEKAYTDLSLLSLNRGDTVKVVADTSDTTKTFRGWVRGSADSGRLVSNIPEYEFVAMTHTMLSAVYSDDTTAGDDVVEYYGWNKHYITTLPATAEAPAAPELTGYEFAEWVLGQSDDNIARKVAQYTAETTTYNVSVPAGVSMFVEGGKYIYDAKVTCTSSENVYWYRDDKLVDYGTSYSFYLWDTTSITTKPTGNNGAKIMLDKSKSNSYMIEYDKGTADVVEVGIIFGNNANITIDNCEEKMNSQRNDFTHGQFSATADEYTTGRGYLIYNDNGTYRVIYAD